MLLMKHFLKLSMLKTVVLLYCAVIFCGNQDSLMNRKLRTEQHLLAIEIFCNFVFCCSNIIIIIIIIVIIIIIIWPLKMNFIGVNEVGQNALYLIIFFTFINWLNIKHFRLAIKYPTFIYTVYIYIYTLYSRQHNYLHKILCNIWPFSKKTSIPLINLSFSHFSPRMLHGNHL